MLPIQLHQLTEVFLKQVCADQWPETQTLEFKAILPLSEESARQEFRKDVCALANADGGDLVYGISEKGGRANNIHAIEGVDVDATKRRLRQILDTKVEPKIHGIQIHACSVEAGGFVLVLRIPSSYDGPHRFGQAAEHRFAIRNDTGTTDMTYDQLRNAFGRGATLLEQASQFRASRVTKIETGQTPRKLAKRATMVAHIIPINGLAGRCGVDVAGLISDHDALRLDTEYPWQRTANINGLLMYAYEDPNGEDCYAQLFRNGAFEIVKNIAFMPKHGDGPSWAIGVWIGSELRRGLQAYSSAATKLGVYGPCFVSLSLTGVAGTNLTINSNFATKRPIVEDRLDLPEIMVEDIASTIDLDSVTKPIMDVLYQSYGQARCNYFDSEGKWNPLR